MRGWLVALAVVSGCNSVEKFAHDRAEHAKARAATEAIDREDEAVLDARPVPVLSGPGVAPGVYRIAEVRVEAYPFKRHDVRWDDAPGELPDLKIGVVVDGTHVATCNAEDDSLTARCKLDTLVDIDARTVIALQITDRDHIGEDEVGTARLEQPSTWDVDTDLPMHPQGRVVSAIIVIHHEPTWLAAHAIRIVSGLAGIALAVLVVVGFRRKLFPEPARDHEPSTEPVLQSPRRRHGFVTMRKAPLAIISVACALLGFAAASLQAPRFGIAAWLGPACWWLLAAASTFTMTRVATRHRLDGWDGFVIAFVAFALALPLMAALAHFGIVLVVAVIVVGCVS